MKHFFLTLCAIVCFALSAHAQNYEDVIYLKNGSIIRGIIVEQVPNESIKIETRDGNLFFYRIDEIQKMTKEVPYGYRKKQSYNSRSFNKPKGYFGLIEAALPLFIGYDNGLSMGFNIINGYRVCPQFAVGGGVGVLGDFFWGGILPSLFSCTCAAISLTERQARILHSMSAITFLCSVYTMECFLLRHLV